ncbi:hypothetical protein EKO04_000997 [Ascochyta lentis]|uniref:Uncharacterized protein n=1 Tax=Ascochyta lentis TaxID=205686 RepID=A0A8H7MNB0_9PLEO|nr:hypothetical protein EKO04_000997 [Ascochyta lentis]
MFVNDMPTFTYTAPVHVLSTHKLLYKEHSHLPHLNSTSYPFPVSQTPYAPFEFALRPNCKQNYDPIKAPFAQFRELQLASARSYTYTWLALQPSNSFTVYTKSLLASLNAAAPVFTPPHSHAEALKALLDNGPVHVAITTEREDAAASPDSPLFLKGVRFDPTDLHMWYGKVLPYLAKCTFVVSSTVDVTYGGSIFGSTAVPHIYNAVTKVELPKFYWFSGVALNRHHNPYLQMCRNLPNLRELCLTMQTTGLTSQRWPERQIVALERTNPEASKERIILSLREVVHRYDLDALFACTSLRRLRLEYIESAMTAYFCRVGNPVDVLQAIKMYLAQGFAQRGLEVAVDLARVDQVSG